MPKPARPLPARPLAARAVRSAADLAALSPADRDRCLRAIVQHCADALALLPAFVTLTRDERRASTGKVGDDELPELEALLDSVDANPGLFTALAPRDGGVDPDAVETAPTRRAIDTLRAMGPALKAVRALDEALSDTRLRLGEQVREVTTAARVIAKANAPVNDGVRAGLAKVEALRVARVKPAAKKPARAPKPA